MTGVNKAIVIGHLGGDPEIKRTTSGNPVATFSVATSESWRDKTTGERKESTDWHRVVVFSEGLCKVVEQYLKKGSKVYLEGQMKTRKYTAQDGKERSVTEVVLKQFNAQLVLLDKADRAPPDESDYGTARTNGSTGDRPGAAPRGTAPRTGPGSDMDDDIPF